MSTRGLCGFRKNGQDKLTYNHFDSYPSGLGKEIVKFCRETSIEDMNAAFDRIVLVNERTQPTYNVIEECKQYADVGVSSGDLNEWYVLLHQAQGTLFPYVQGLDYMIDNASFIIDSLFCEFAYIVNLDTNMLEFWRGFQTHPDLNNRYGAVPDGSYYPCIMIKEYPLSSLEENTYKKMNKEIYGK